MCLYETLSRFMSIYPDVLFGDFLRYAIGAGGVYLVINIWLSSHLSARKIRVDSPSRKQLAWEIAASLRTVLIFACVGSTIVFGAQLGIFTIYTDIQDYGWWYLAGSLVLLIVLHDAWFYWTHKAMHYPPIYRKFHRLHHRSHNPSPFTSYSFDIGEAIINAIYLPLVLLLIPAHPLMLFLFVTHMMARNAIGHCGYELFPSNGRGKPMFDWMTTVTHHDLHHSHAGYNLGLYFTWWDRLMKSEHPYYYDEYAKSVRNSGSLTANGS